VPPQQLPVEGQGGTDNGADGAGQCRILLWPFLATC
jgi:hypothetical protein